MARKKVKTAAQAGANWRAGMTSPTTVQKYGQSIDAMQDNPMEQAAAPDAMQRYRDNTAAASQQRMPDALRKVSFTAWKGAAKAGAATGFQRGAQKGGQKYDSHARDSEQVWQQQSDAAANLPKGGVEEALAKVRAVITIAKQAAGKM